MYDKILNHLRKMLEIRVQGKNINRFIRRLATHQIEILNIRYVDEDIVNIVIYESDFKKLEDIKTIYSVEIIKNKGLLYVKEIIKKNHFVLLSLALGYIILLFLSNVIFDIEVIHTDKSLRELLENELSSYGISKYHIKKNYNKINEIKENILNAHKNRIEWLEIEEVGTKYIVRVEERILNQKDKDITYQDIVAKKPAIIMEVNAKKGQIVKNKLSYVKTGDTIISGYITLNENVKDTVRAEGTVYGEVWYKVSVEYPLHYEEEIPTKNKKKILSIHFLERNYDFFNFHPYAAKKVESKTLLKNNLLPFSLSLDEQTEINVINENYTKEEAIEKAKQKIREKIEGQLNDKERILEIKQLKVEENNSTIILEAFVTVYEDITDTKEIPEYIEPPVAESE